MGRTMLPNEISNPVYALETQSIWFETRSISVLASTIHWILEDLYGDRNTANSRVISVLYIIITTHTIVTATKILRFDVNKLRQYHIEGSGKILGANTSWIITTGVDETRPRSFVFEQTKKKIDFNVRLKNVRIRMMLERLARILTYILLEEFSRYSDGKVEFFVLLQKWLENCTRRRDE